MKSKHLRIKLLLVALAILVIGTTVVLYLYFQPHRNVQETKTDFSYPASEIVNEYIANPEAANNKFLDQEGDSKIIEVKGKVAELSTNFNGNLVVLLSDTLAPAGVSCTFLNSPSSPSLVLGQEVIIKGVIRAGASYDSDLDMYEHVILEECALKP